MYVLNMKANYDLEKQNSCYVCKERKLGLKSVITLCSSKKIFIHDTSRKVSQGIDDFKHSHKNNQFSTTISFQFVVLTTSDRLKTDVYSSSIA